MIKKTDWRGQSNRPKQMTPYMQVIPTPYALMDFPAAPNLGDQFLAPNGTLYQWDGTVWIGVSDSTVGSFLVPVGLEPPLNPQPGQLWWRNDPDGNLYLFYNDGNSSQWVPAAQPNSGGGIPDAPADGQQYVRQDGAWVAVVIP
jgi:Fibritin C-terminal region